MIKNFCDKCGKNDKDNKKNIKGVSIFVGMQTITKKDLCKECMDKLLDFIL